MLEGRQLHEKSFHFMFFPSQFTGLSPKKRNAIISNPGNSSSIHKVIDIRSTKHPLAGENILPKLPSPNNVENFNFTSKIFFENPSSFFPFFLTWYFSPQYQEAKIARNGKSNFGLSFICIKIGQIQKHF